MKEYAESFYKSKAWQECRAAYVKYRRGLCEDCLKIGIYSPGVIVHHIVHITPENIEDPRITLGFQNLRLVCRECHAKEHKPINAFKRYEIDQNGRVICRI